MTESSQGQSFQSETQGNEESANERYEGTRFKVLKDVMSNTIKSFTRNLKLIKPIPNVDTNILIHLQNEIISQMEKGMKSEFDQMCEEENIEHLLNNLDKMAEAQTGAGNLKGWKPSRDVAADLRAHTVAMKREKLKALQKMLTDLEAQNKLLRNKAEKKENNLIQTRGEIKQIVDNIAEITETEKTAIDSLN